MFGALSVAGIACFATYFYLRVRHDNMTRLKALVWVFGLFFCLGCFAWMAAGCAGFDNAARATTQATHDPLVQVAAATSPWGETVLSLVNSAAVIGLYVSQRVQSARHKDLKGQIDQTREIASSVADAVSKAVPA